MTSGDLLKQLFQSYMRRQDEEFRATALRIIAQEKEKNHHVLASQLDGILANGSFPTARQMSVSLSDELPKDRERSSILVEVKTPRHFLDEMVLDEGNRRKIETLLEEYRRGELLKTHGIRPRSKLLLCGPPGCGKTMCAEVMATELGLAMLYTRFDAIVSSYLGETAANLRKAFDFAARGTWVLFFDEFDAIGKSREDAEEHGELKRVVNSFLQILDGFMSESLVIAATNHEGLLDTALWRRFDEIIFFGKPTVRQIEVLLHKKLANFPHETIDFALLARSLKGLSHADVERICLNAIRYCITKDVERLSASILSESAELEKARLRLTAGVVRGRSKRT